MILRQRASISDASLLRCFCIKAERSTCTYFGAVAKLRLQVLSIYEYLNDWASEGEFP